MNVIAETKAGRADRVVVAGAHLDSVAEGPGIQDNGSGSAAILEIALQMDNLGSGRATRYASSGSGRRRRGFSVRNITWHSLTKRQIKNIAVNLNFDMIASPNFVPFVYDGDGSASAPAGTQRLEGGRTDLRPVPDEVLQAAAADSLRWPLGLRSVHRCRNSGGWAVHRRRGI